uniref:Uncharacterized protein n=1 Tax=Oryza sativa subsp. japonica TaxID=39947 RepID=Q6EUF6_ORYSJ|nr:hypothetical protein [Oryza sativa Japonica Group]
MGPMWAPRISHFFPPLSTSLSLSPIFSKLHGRRPAGAGGVGRSCVRAASGGGWAGGRRPAGEELGGGARAPRRTNARPAPPCRPRGGGAPRRLAQPECRRRR